jgi:hypothetical protein
MSKYVFMLALAPLLVAPAHAQRAQIPKLFQGEWSYLAEGSSGACKRGDYEKHENDGLMKVAVDSVGYWESYCEAKSAKSADDVLTLDMACRGEGETWRETSVWTLKTLHGKETLIVYSQVKTRKMIHAYARCQ